jgi:hypothetical protein
MERILFVVACEGNYQGLHGINDYTFLEFDPDDKLMDRLAAIARDVGSDLIWNLIESYDCIDEDEDEESAYENGEYHGFYFETDYTPDQLEDFYLNDYGYDDFDEFVEKFGGKEVE